MKKVAIVGYTSTREFAPYKDPEFEIWGLNDLYEYIPKYDRWFDLHNKHFINKQMSTRTDRKQIEVLKSMKCPVYMQSKYKDIPSSVKYPLRQIIDHFSSCYIGKNRETVKLNYFTSSISYMLALAIFEGFEEIHVYGVDLAVGTEYDQQRPSCEFWLGVVVGRGIKLHIPSQSDLLKAVYLYGYEDPKADMFKDKLDKIVEDVNGKKTEAAQQRSNWDGIINQHYGAIEILKAIQDDPEFTKNKIPSIIAEREKQKAEATQQKTNWHDYVNQYSGCVQGIKEVRKNWIMEVN